MLRIPRPQGRYILQDLPAVIEAGDRVCQPEVEVQPYNFFEQEQPVKGAAAYPLKLILHDWQDAECRNNSPKVGTGDARLQIEALDLRHRPVRLPARPSEGSLRYQHVLHGW
ncbi:hypothetical protein BDW59DRAFT_148851 [Aspergillus cavernicola]|uniref:O-methyltransferase C-terminal domain-containing protein n=1 Tax=Aspergillus cavernicola TaxID=176166 RepID=A0ABR4I6N1_9EURO